VSKQRSRRFHMERFNLKKLNGVEGNEECCVEVSNRFAVDGLIHCMSRLHMGINTLLEHLARRGQDICRKWVYHIPL
jgi:hypothetical protein